MKKTAFILSVAGCLLTLASCNFKQEAKPTATQTEVVINKTVITTEVKVGFKYDIKGTYKEQYDDEAIWEVTDTQITRKKNNYSTTYPIERYTEHYAKVKGGSYYDAFMEDGYIFLFSKGELQYTLHRVTE